MFSFYGRIQLNHILAVILIRMITPTNFRDLSNQEINDASLQLSSHFATVSPANEFLGIEEVHYVSIITKLLYYCFLLNY